MLQKFAWKALFQKVIFHKKEGKKGSKSLYANTLQIKVIDMHDGRHININEGYGENAPSLSRGRRTKHEHKHGKEER